MIFTNQATLTYNLGAINSNSVTGEIQSPLTLLKNASTSSYVPGEQFQYTVTIMNSSSQTYTGLVLQDNLGMYLFQGYPRFDLSYINQSATLTYYSSTGIVESTVVATYVTEGINFTLDIPGNTVALVRYSVQPTIFAPLLAGSSIENTVILTGNAPRLPLSASHTLPIADQVDLTITKNTNTAPVIGQPLTFTFTVLNYGNIAISDSDYVVVSDFLDPPLTGITVYANGVLWTEGVEYLYNESLFYFLTESNVIDLGPATITQDDFGRWIVSPSALVITVTGTVSATLAAQALMEVLPSYTDGREAFLEWERLQNDKYVLGGTGDVPASFMILSQPVSALSLDPSSDSRFTLTGNILTVDTSALTAPIYAGVQVDYGAGFILDIEYKV